MNRFGKMLLVGVSAVSLSAQAQAQDAPEAGTAATTTGSLAGEIVVQARRRDESLQDVPLMVDAVTAESIAKLNIREFTEIQSLVPGLSLASNANGIGGQAALRGIAFDVTASGNNGTVEFYMNDAPISAGVLFQSMFDVQQIEVLRGPQGTLRGRASPSGSITVTTRRPDLYEAGGYALGTLNDIGGWNVNGALNIPVVEGILGLRLAGVVDENDGNEVRSINSSFDPSVKTVGGRISLRAEPADWLSLNASYTTTKRDSVQFEQVESLSLADPTAPLSPVTIEAGDRASVMANPRTYTQNFDILNWQAQVRFGGQKLDYVGSQTEQKVVAVDPQDRGNFFGSEFPAALRAISQNTDSRAKQTTHELRLSNDERVLDIFDYVIGGLYSKLTSPTALTQQTPLFLGIATPASFFTPTPANLASIINTPITRGSGTKEKSFFANITAHVTDRTEISGGLRYIDYRSTGYLTINGVDVPAAAEDRKFDHTIYSASIKHPILHRSSIGLATASWPMRLMEVRGGQDPLPIPPSFVRTWTQARC